MITSGTLNVDGDRDWFRVTLVAGAQYIFSLSSSANTFAPSIGLFDSKGARIEAGSWLSNSYGIDNVGYTATVSGSYYVQVGSIYMLPGEKSQYQVWMNRVIDDFSATRATTGRIPATEYGASGKIDGFDGGIGIPDPVHPAGESPLPHRLEPGRFPLFRGE